MDSKTFIKTVAPRIGPHNAINNLTPIQQSALVKLLIEKGIINSDELEAKTKQEFRLAADSMLKMPIPSPVQFKHKN